jgi:hypothetical protein
MPRVQRGKYGSLAWKEFPDVPTFDSFDHSFQMFPVTQRELRAEIVCVSVDLKTFQRCSKNISRHIQTMDIDVASTAETQCSSCF